VTFKTSLFRSIKKDKVTKEAISATYEEKYEDKAHNLELSGKLTTNSEYTGTVLLKDLIGAGSKFELNINKTPDSLSASPLLIYKTDNLAFKGKMVYPISGKKSPIKLAGEMGFLFSSLYGGIGTTISRDTPKTSIDLEGVAAYADKNHQLTARVKHTLQSAIVNLGLSYYYRYHSRCPVAFEVNTDTTFEKFSVNAGAQKRSTNTLP